MCNIKETIYFKVSVSVAFEKCLSLTKSLFCGQYVCLTYYLWDYADFLDGVVQILQRREVFILFYLFCSLNQPIYIMKLSRACLEMLYGEVIVSTFYLECGILTYCNLLDFFFFSFLEHKQKCN